MNIEQVTFNIKFESDFEFHKKFSLYYIGFILKKLKSQHTKYVQKINIIEIIAKHHICNV